MTVPGWYPLLLLGLATYRICRLVGWDEITAPLRARLALSDAEHSQWLYVLNAFDERDLDAWDYYSYTTEIQSFVHDLALSLGIGLEDPTLPPLVQRRLDQSHLEGPNDRSIIPFTKRAWYLAKLIRCPWCLGAWVGTLVWVGYQLAPHGMLLAMSLPALLAVPGLIKQLDS